MAGNASDINDGAAAVVLMDGKLAKARGVTPLARLVGYAHVGVDPKYMGIGPVPATRKVLEKVGLTIRDMDVVEANEAFAAQACAVSRQLNLDPAKVNPNGSGIALGHPIGATGAVITVKALHELHRCGGAVCPRDANAGTGAPTGIDTATHPADQTVLHDRAHPSHVFAPRHPAMTNQ